MNALRNKVQLIGHLGAKVEIKALESGKAVGSEPGIPHVTILNAEKIAWTRSPLRCMNLNRVLALGKKIVRILEMPQTDFFA